MNIYIKSAAAISAQESGEFPISWRYQETVRLSLADPDYKNWIDPKQIRRMGRAIKMGVAASHMALERAHCKLPNAIIMGTAYGCLADTGVFLHKMVDQQEDMLTPTAFIQSTHNTVGGQIALLLQCHGYNNTFVHGAFSLEHALLDSMLLLKEQPTYKILTGSVDELTEASFQILKRFRLFKRLPVNSKDLMASTTPGTIAGEGASFFVLHTEKDSENWARLIGLEMLYKPKEDLEIQAKLDAFLANHHLKISDVDCIMTGLNGDARRDAEQLQRIQKHFPQTPLASFKQLSGEYPTANGFGLYLAAQILKEGTLPQGVLLPFSQPFDGSVKRILLWNHWLDSHQSFILLESC
jgi:3-oxoacyl-[acyl-carrier-protein] synthase II